MSRTDDGGKKTIKVYESTHARIEAARREGETFAEAVERLVGGSGLGDMYGVLDDEAADAMRDAIEESHETDADAVAEIEERVGDGG